MSCLKRVLSTNGVEPPSSSLMPDKKGKGDVLQSSMWNLLRKYDEYIFDVFATSNCIQLYILYCISLYLDVPPIGRVINIIKSCKVIEVNPHL